MRLGELQVDDKRKGQLMYSIGQMLKESSTPNPTPNPTPYPLSNEQELLNNKWKYRQCFKCDLITKMQDGEGKNKEEKNCGGPLKKIVSLEYLVMKCKSILRVWS